MPTPKDKSNPKDKPAQPTEASSIPEQKSQPIENAPMTSAAPKPHDEEDVQALLARKTADGKGDEDVPPSDFHSFATEGVEDKKDLLSIQDVTNQVLSGRWGPTQEIAVGRLAEAGYDVRAVAEEFKRRKDGGAPSAF